MNFFQHKQYPANTIWLAFLRCGIGLLCLLHFLAVQPDFNNLFGENGFVPPDILDAAKPAYMPTIYSIHAMLQPLTGLSYVAVLMAVRIAYPLCLLLLMAGFCSRAFAIASLFFQLVIVSSISYYNYGVDVFTTICLFYCCVFPVGKVYSLDNKLFKNRTPLANHTKYLSLFRAHICIAYFFSGFEKAIGHSWRNGEATWKMVHGYNSTSFLNLDFLSNTPVFIIVAWATIVLETLYPLFINIEKTRRVWLFSTILFHLAIAVFIGLYFFSGVMILINLTCYYAPFIKEEKQVASSLLKRGLAIG